MKPEEISRQRGKETPPFFPFRSARLKQEYHALVQARARAWPVAHETQVIETPSGETFVRLSGNPADPPLVLLPGSRAHSLTWIPNIAALSAHYRTYALDTIYDVGMSVRRRKLKTPQDLVDWLDEVLAVLVPDEAIRLAGISYGGWLASQYALQFPDRLQKLVLISPAATVLPVSFPFLLRAMLLLLPRRSFVKKFLYWLLDDMVQSGEAGRATVDQAVDEWVVALRSFRPLPLIGATVIPDQAWQALQVPTCVLVGEHEKVYSAQKAVERLNRVAPQVKTGLFPQAGHDLWMVQADRVNQKLLSFFGDS